MYDKISVDNTFTIKYYISFGEKRIWRRYSEFEKLMAFLNQKYEGVILPEMPPKEGIKGNLTYFWGIDKNFLDARKIKL